MQEVKHCKRCGCVIALEADSDYYSYIRIKYCDPCAAGNGADPSGKRRHSGGYDADGACNR